MVRGDDTGPYVPSYGDVMVGETLEDGLFLRIYYPSSLSKDQDHTSRWRSWLPHQRYLTGFAYVLGLWRFLFHLLYRLMAGDVKLPAPIEAPLTPFPTKLPTVVFSHGMGGTRFLYSGICCELAAHGCVVAAVEHRDESAAVTWHYNKKTKARDWLKFLHLPVGTDQSPTRIHQVEKRSTQILQTLKFLHNLDGGKVGDNLIEPEPASDFSLAMFSSRLDLSAPILVGHSFGGATALLTLARTPEFKTGIILDPWMYPIRNYDTLPASIKQPLLCINMQTFQIAPNLRILRQFTSGSQPGPRENYTIRHSTHENQSDSVHLIGYWLNFFIKKINPVVATHVNNALIIRFLRQYAGLVGPTEAEDVLSSHEYYVVEGLTVDGIKNKSKKIPRRWLSLG